MINIEANLTGGKMRRGGQSGMVDNKDLQPLLRIDDVARILRVSRRTVHELKRDKVNPLPYCKIGQQVRIRPDDFSSWIESKRVNGQPIEHNAQQRRGSRDGFPPSLALRGRKRLAPTTPKCEATAGVGVKAPAPVRIVAKELS